MLGYGSIICRIMKISLTLLYLSWTVAAIVYRRDSSKDGMTCDGQDKVFMIKDNSPIFCCAVCESTENCTSVAFHEESTVCIGCLSNSTPVDVKLESSVFYTQKDLLLTTTSPKTTEMTSSLIGQQTSFPDVEVASVPVGGGGWHIYKGRYYRFFDVNLRRSEALAYCKGESGLSAFLVVIGDSETNEFVKIIAFKDKTDHDIIHIGMRLDGGQTVAYFFGTSINYNNFFQPPNSDDDCIYMVRSGEWKTFECDANDALPFVCESG